MNDRKPKLRLLDYNAAIAFIKANHSPGSSPGSVEKNIDCRQREQSCPPQAYRPPDQKDRARSEVRPNKLERQETFDGSSRCELGKKASRKICKIKSLAKSYTHNFRVSSGSKKPEATGKPKKMKAIRSEKKTAFEMEKRRPIEFGKEPARELKIESAIELDQQTAVKIKKTTRMSKMITKKAEQKKSTAVELEMKAAMELGKKVAIELQKKNAVKLEKKLAVEFEEKAAIKVGKEAAVNHIPTAKLEMETAVVEPSKEPAIEVETSCISIELEKVAEIQQTIEFEDENVVSSSSQALLMMNHIAEELSEKENMATSTIYESINRQCQATQTDEYPNVCTMVSDSQTSPGPSNSDAFFNIRSYSPDLLIDCDETEETANASVNCEGHSLQKETTVTNLNVYRLHGLPATMVMNMCESSDHFDKSNKDNRSMDSQSECIPNSMHPKPSVSYLNDTPVLPASLQLQQMQTSSQSSGDGSSLVSNVSNHTQILRKRPSLPNLTSGSNPSQKKEPRVAVTQSMVPIMRPGVEMNHDQRLPAHSENWRANMVTTNIHRFPGTMAEQQVQLNVSQRTPTFPQGRAPDWVLMNNQYSVPLARDANQQIPYFQQNQQPNEMAMYNQSPEEIHMHNQSSSEIPMYNQRSIAMPIYNQYPIGMHNQSLVRVPMYNQSPADTALHNQSSILLAEPRVEINSISTKWLPPNQRQNDMTIFSSQNQNDITMFNQSHVALMEPRVERIANREVSLPQNQRQNEITMFDQSHVSVAEPRIDRIANPMLPLPQNQRQNEITMFDQSHVSVVEPRVQRRVNQRVWRTNAPSSSYPYNLPHPNSYFLRPNHNVQYAQQINYPNRAGQFTNYRPSQNLVSNAANEPLMHIDQRKMLYRGQIFNW